MTATVLLIAMRMTVVIMRMTMMITLGIRIIVQNPGQKRFHRRICIADNTRINLDPSSSQSILGAGANTAADQSVN